MIKIFRNPISHHFDRSENIYPIIKYGGVMDDGAMNESTFLKLLDFAQK